MNHSVSDSDDDIMIVEANEVKGRKPNNYIEEMNNSDKVIHVLYYIVYINTHTHTHTQCVLNIHTYIYIYIYIYRYIYIYIILVGIRNIENP